MRLAAVNTRTRFDAVPIQANHGYFAIGNDELLLKQENDWNPFGAIGLRILFRSGQWKTC
jgi:hypothetical protein